MANYDIEGALDKAVDAEAKKPRAALGSKPKPETKAKAVTKKARPVESKETEANTAVPRKNVAIRREHALRLRAVKEKELQRLGVDSQKVVSIRSLLDDAIDQYLEKMEQGANQEVSGHGS